MVSFCDIPLSQIQKHTKSYGSYGIGMSKDWGLRKGLGPVQYVSPESSYAKSQKIVFKSIVSGNIIWKDLSDEQFAMFDLLRYRKKYEGRLIRGTNIKENYRFYDEREWRYVPPRSDKYPMAILGKIYRKMKLECNAKLDNIFLDFEPSDIRYIVVKSDSEISDFVNVIRKAKENFQHYDVERLTTRIITKEQIDSDF